MTSSADKVEAESLYDEGNVKARMRMFKDALSLYDKAISLDASNPMYFDNRALCLKRMGSVQEAINQYEKIVQSFPEYGNVFLSIGSTRIETGDYQGAVSAYARFYSACNKRQFDSRAFELGAIDQLVYGQNIEETIILTSINYLSEEQKKLAIQAIREGNVAFKHQPKKYRDIYLQLNLNNSLETLEIKCSLFCIYSAPSIPFNQPSKHQGQYFDALVVINNRDMKLSDPRGYEVDCTNYKHFVDEDGVIWDVRGYAMYTYDDETKYPDDWKYFLEKGTSGWTFHLRKRPQQEEQ